jgi:predicted enzyme related to lactoylglutathione lyase
MARVTGLGGIFVKTDDPAGLREWYRTRLGIDVEDFGASFQWREAMNPDVTGYSVWGVFPQATHYFDPSSRPFMINFRVDDLDGVLKSLRSAGESVADGVHEDEYGRFGWAMDPDGTRIELWQPPAAGAAAPEGFAATIRRFLEAVDAGDEAALAGCFDPEASMYFPFREPPGLVEGREAIITRFRGLFAAWRRREKAPPFVGFVPQELSVRAAGPGHALATFIVGIEGSSGRRTALGRQTLEGWRILHLHASNPGVAPKG